MKVIIDIEANGLENPTEIWLIVCKDIDTGALHVFRKVTQDEKEKQRFLAFASQVEVFIGHNFLGYDYPVLKSLLIGFDIGNSIDKCIDTLIISKLIDYSRDGHGVEHYGYDFGLPKGDFLDFTKYSKDMEEYCIRDVDITHKIYLKYLRYINDKA